MEGVHERWGEGESKGGREDRMGYFILGTASYYHYHIVFIPYLSIPMGSQVGFSNSKNNQNQLHYNASIKTIKAPKKRISIKSPHRRCCFYKVP